MAKASASTDYGYDQPPPNYESLQQNAGRSS